MNLSTDDFVRALSELLERDSAVIVNGFKMLKRHYESEGQIITATELADAVASSSYQVGNSQYGKFAHEVSDLLGVAPQEDRDGNPIWTFTICRSDGYGGPQGHLQWLLKDEVAAAIEQLNIVKKSITASPGVDIEIREEWLRGLPEKVRSQVVDARIGQGEFRRRLFNVWQGCSVTGLDVPDFLNASHIKPWRDCDENEAVDVTNGLLLSPALDRAFDRGFITFENSGDIRISGELDVPKAETLSISPAMKMRKIFPQHLPFLEYHRANVFRG